MKNLKKYLVKTVAGVLAISMISLSFGMVSFASELPEEIIAEDEAVEDTAKSNVSKAEEGGIIGDAAENVVSGDGNASGDTMQEDTTVNSDPNTDMKKDDSVYGAENEIIAGKGIIEEEDKPEEVASEKDTTEEIVVTEEVSVNAAEILEAVVANTVSGWQSETVEGTTKWRYYEGGSPLTDTVRKIGQYWYGFDFEGYMDDDESFALCDAETGVWYYYRAKEGGHLYVNEWYKDEGEDYLDWAYYGDGGRASEDPCVKAVNGTEYLFGMCGFLIMDGAIVIRNVRYASDEYGHAVRLQKGGWTKVGKTWYYVNADNTIYEYCVAVINGNYYYFSFDGRIVDDEIAEAYSSITGDFVYYRTKENGSLYYGEWYYAEKEGCWYYYPKEGASEGNAVLEVNGKNYLFTEKGRLTVNACITIDGNCYVSDENGITVKLDNNKWTKSGEYYYYCENGTALRACVKEINGSLYGFDDSYRMFAGRTFELYDSTSGKYKKYRADSSGRLFREMWALGYDSSSEDSNWHYYDENGELVESGLKNINGQWYFFASGNMMTGCYALDNGAIYRVGNNGRAYAVTNANGLFYDVYDAYAVYAENGKTIKSSWVNINNRWFYLGANGYAFRDGSYSVGEKRYFFNADGSMAAGGFVKSDKATYYASEGGALLIGQQKIGEKWYYFNSAGEMYRNHVKYNGKNYILYPDGSWWFTATEGWNNPKTDVWYYVKNGEICVNVTEEINSSTYYFDESGMMAVNCIADGMIFGNDGKQVMNEGWYELNGEWYYIQGTDAKGGNIICDDILYKNGFRYAFDTKGRLITNASYNGVWYDGSGHAVNPRGKDNGWILSGGAYYYYENGKKVTNRWVNGYYLGGDGAMLTNSRTPDGYYVGEDGKYIKKSVVGNLVIKADGKIGNHEWVLIDGKYYYADEQGCKGSYKVAVINNNLCRFDENGVYQETVAENVQNDKWYAVGSEWTYITDGRVASGIVRTGGDNRYFFGEDGYMQRNARAMDEITGRIILFDENGIEDKSVSGWRNGYYYGLDHRTSYGWIATGGKTYYNFSGTGTDYRSEYELIRGRLYKFNKDGSLNGEVYQLNGWLKLDGKLYFFKNGRAQTGLVTISDKTYALSTDGVLVKNGIARYDDRFYYINSEGCVEKTTGFKTVKGKNFYVDANGAIRRGIHLINGKIYYLTVKEDDIDFRLG